MTGKERQGYNETDLRNTVAFYTRTAAETGTANLRATSRDDNDHAAPPPEFPHRHHEQSCSQSFVRARREAAGGLDKEETCPSAGLRYPASVQQSSELQRLKAEHNSKEPRWPAGL